MYFVPPWAEVSITNLSSGSGGKNAYLSVKTIVFTILLSIGTSLVYNLFNYYVPPGAEVSIKNLFSVSGGKNVYLSVKTIFFTIFILPNLPCS